MFAACGRGETETRSLLAYYGVPVVLTTDQGSLVLTSSDQVVAAVHPQVEGLRGTFSRRRADGSEIGRLAATYLITDGSVGRRISVLAVHGARSTSGQR